MAQTTAIGYRQRAAGIAVRIRRRQSQCLCNSGLLIGEFGDATLRAGASVQDVAAVLAAHFQNMVVTSPSRVGPALLLFLLALRRWADNNDGDG